MIRQLAIALTLIGTGVAWAQAPAESNRGRMVVRQPRTLEILNQRLPEVQIVEQPFEQVVEWLSELTRMSIVVRWQTLEDAGIDRDASVSIKARNLRFSQVLWLLMNQVGGSDIQLAYRASGTLLVLSTEEDLGKEMITKVYDVSDLLLSIPRAARTQAFDVTQGLGQGGQGGGGGGGGGQGMFQQNQQNQQNQNEDVQNQDNLQIETLMEIIRDTVEPDSWRENGGQGSVTAFRRLLIVHNTILVHQRLGGYVTTDEDVIVGS